MPSCRTGIARGLLKKLLGNISQIGRSSTNPMPSRPLAIASIIAFCAGGSVAQRNATATAIHTYLQPYAQSGNFAGDVLVEKNGKVVFEKAYGFADQEKN